ncbi:MAG: hypothetical protein LDL19_04345 [Thiobacillus sp.]|nr:hypothetical protein [Thiobacillus sp.]
MPPLRMLILATLTIAAPLANADTGPTATTVAKPDIAIEGSLNEIMIGGGTGLAARRITWRHRQLTMYPDWAVGGTQKGECKIQLMYKLSNLGDAPTGRPFKVQLLNNDKVVGEDRIEPLGPKESRVIVTHGLFTRGQHWFTLRIDPDNAVSESLEDNNEHKFDYTLNGKCPASHKPGSKQSGPVQPTGITRPAG